MVTLPCSHCSELLAWQRGRCGDVRLHPMRGQQVPLHRLKPLLAGSPSCPQCGPKAWERPKGGALREAESPLCYWLPPVPGPGLHSLFSAEGLPGQDGLSCWLDESQRRPGPES